MNSLEKFDFERLIGNHTLIYGETNTKKTLFTAQFVQYLLETLKMNPLKISILDFAPKLQTIDDKKIGGKIKDYYRATIRCKNHSYDGDIIPPRLKAKNKQELYSNACLNYKKTRKILNDYMNDPTTYLIINDISIYLHVGNKKDILSAIYKSETFLGNSYYGSSIRKGFSKHFSLKEKRDVDYLIENLDNTYFTG